MDSPTTAAISTTAAMIFEKPSLRTRVTFEAGMVQMGGAAINLDPSQISLGKRESVSDAAKSLSRWVDAIIARTYSHSLVTELAKYASVPVINALTDLHHPCQALALGQTLMERRGKLSGLKIVFVGDGNNVANSWIELAGIFPMHFVLSAPKGFEPDPVIMQKALAAGISKIEISNDPIKAAKDADVLYTDVWTSMGQEEEKQKRLTAFKGFSISEELLEYASPNCLVMHCLPAHRGEEITDEAMIGSQSVIFDQAENRLHIQKALLCSLFGSVDSSIQYEFPIEAKHYEKTTTTVST